MSGISSLSIYSPQSVQSAAASQYSSQTDTSRSSFAIPQPLLEAEESQDLGMQAQLPTNPPVYPLANTPVDTSLTSAIPAAPPLPENISTTSSNRQAYSPHSSDIPAVPPLSEHLRSHSSNRQTNAPHSSVIPAAPPLPEHLRSLLLPSSTSLSSIPTPPALPPYLSVMAHPHHDEIIAQPASTTTADMFTQTFQPNDGSMSIQARQPISSNLLQSIDTQHPNDN